MCRLRKSISFLEPVPLLSSVQLGAAYRTFRKRRLQEAILHRRRCFHKYMSGKSMAQEELGMQLQQLEVVVRTLFETGVLCQDEPRS